LAAVCLHSAELSSDQRVEKPAAYFPHPDSDGGWRTATKAEDIRAAAGIELPKLAQAWEFTQRCTQNGGFARSAEWLAGVRKYFGRASRNTNPDMGLHGQGLYQHCLRNHVKGIFTTGFPMDLDTKVFTPKVPTGSPSVEGNTG